MRLPEQRLYDWVQRRIGHAAFVERVENRVKRDTPDLYVNWPGHCGWVELKVLDDFPVRTATPVRIPHWTNGQRYWALRHAVHGGKTWLLLQVGDELFVVDAARAARFSETWTQADWRKNAQVLNKRHTLPAGVLDAMHQAMV